uniref:Uncharacterized protein n=1 Tax=Oryza meridionalis TaxID=40149 RepID=A0A0E0FDQ0_9ORYZ
MAPKGVDPPPAAELARRREGTMWQEKAASVKSYMLPSLLPVGGAYRTELPQPAGLQVDRALWPARQPAFVPLHHAWHAFLNFRRSVVFGGYVLELRRRC